MRCGSTTFSLSFRDVELLPAERGIIVSYESIRFCCKLWIAPHEVTAADDVRP